MAALLAAVPTVLALAGGLLFGGNGPYYLDFRPLDGIGFQPVAQGLGIGYLGDTGMTILHALRNAELTILLFALPVPMVVAAALLRRRWRNRTTLAVAALLGVLAVVNLVATPVSLFSDLVQCPPPDYASLPDGYSCFRDGSSGIPSPLYAVPYALAAYILLKLHRRSGNAGQHAQSAVRSST
ncbi:hypothetical protein DP939_08665 [Spongiactinospora rosea]|uniref:Uncharacterized protein n=1 Tax=Spongiactinospora rosea TaxID=2248750 RepID=A0A366M4E3_9ACTN|nr:hypothetical protein DP939_08665 [Spongiactinospora rosea]